MAWGSLRSFPHAILHIDGDSFFASCEVAKDPSLRGKPVITGKERGIVSSMTYEARALGVRRAMPLHEIKQKFPQVIILPSDYETYSLFSNRMYAIVRRYTPTVEEYSIDECFADLTGLRRSLRMPYTEMAASIKRDLERELGISFSMGLAATKVLAKIGSKWQKPAGLTPIPLSEARKFLEKTRTISVWGIGPNTAAYLERFGIRTALEFAMRDEAWVCAHASKPIVEIWKELNGHQVYEVDAAGRESYQSISKTRTFTPPSRDRELVFSQLSKNIENACLKARRWDLASDRVVFFLKTQEFKYHSCEVKLSHASSVPQDILKAIAQYFPSVFAEGLLPRRPHGVGAPTASSGYRATGIALLNLRAGATVQLDLFGGALRSEGLKQVFESVDEICEKYGKHTVFLASSFGAMAPKNSKLSTGQVHARHEVPERHRNLFHGENARQRLNIPMLGDV